MLPEVSISAISKLLVFGNEHINVRFSAQAQLTAREFFSAQGTTVLIDSRTFEPNFRDETGGVPSRAPPFYLWGQLSTTTDRSPTWISSDAAKRSGFSPTRPSVVSMTTRHPDPHSSAGNLKPTGFSDGLKMM